MENKLIKIFMNVLEINRNGDNEVFFDIAPHTKEISFRVYFGKWELNKDPDILFRAYYDKGPDYKATGVWGKSINRILEVSEMLLRG